MGRPSVAVFLGVAEFTHQSSVRFVGLAQNIAGFPLRVGILLAAGGCLILLVATDVEPRRLRGPALHVVARDDALGAGPVSYTHLTLPTSDLV